MLFRLVPLPTKPFSPPISFSCSHFLPPCLFRREGRRRRRRNGGACDDVGGAQEGGGIKAVVRLPVPSQDLHPSVLTLLALGSSPLLSHQHHRVPHLPSGSPPFLRFYLLHQ